MDCNDKDCTEYGMWVEELETRAVDYDSIDKSTYLPDYKPCADCGKLCCQYHSYVKGNGDLPRCAKCSGLED